MRMAGVKWLHPVRTHSRVLPVRTHKCSLWTLTGAVSTHSQVLFFLESRCSEERENKSKKASLISPQCSLVSVRSCKGWGRGASPPPFCRQLCPKKETLRSGFSINHGLHGWKSCTKPVFHLLNNINGGFSYKDGRGHNHTAATPSLPGSLGECATDCHCPFSSVALTAREKLKCESPALTCRTQNDRLLQDLLVKWTQTTVRRRNVK